MCGLFGVIRGRQSRVINDTSYANFIKAAILCGTLRGADGTGGFSISKANDILVRKMPVPGPYFLSTEEGRSLVDDIKFKSAVVGHHRSSTRGRHTYENTHPFLHKIGGNSIVGVHNGVISNAPFTEDGINFEVDSSWALYKILKHGDEGFTKLSGSYSLVYYQSSTKTMQFVSNEQRPLYFTFVRDDNALCFASERGMLEWLMIREGLTPDGYKAKDKADFYYVAKGTGIRFDFEDVRQFTNFEVPVYEAPKSTYSSSTGTGQYTPYGGQNYYTEYEYPDSNKTSDTKTIQKEGGESAGRFQGERGGYCPVGAAEAARKSQISDVTGTFKIEFYQKKARRLIGTFFFSAKGGKDPAKRGFEAEINGLSASEFAKFRLILQKHKEIHTSIIGVVLPKSGVAAEKRMKLFLDKPFEFDSTSTDVAN